MAVQLPLVNSALYFQDHLPLEPTNHEEMPLLSSRQHESSTAAAPANQSPKKEQNRLAAQKMRAKQRHIKNEVEEKIKMFDADNLKLMLKKADLESKIRDLRALILDSQMLETVVEVSKKSHPIKPSISRHVQATVVPLEPKVEVAPASAVYVAPKVEIVAPPPPPPPPVVTNTLADDDQFKYNVPTFFLEGFSDAAQMPTQVENRDKSSKLVVAHDMVVTPIMTQNWQPQTTTTTTTTTMQTDDNQDNCCDLDLDFIFELKSFNKEPEPEISAIIDEIIATNPPLDFQKAATTPPYDLLQFTSPSNGASYTPPEEPQTTQSGQFYGLMDFDQGFYVNPPFSDDPKLGSFYLSLPPPPANNYNNNNNYMMVNHEQHALGNHNAFALDPYSGFYPAETNAADWATVLDGGQYLPPFDQNSFVTDFNKWP